MSANIFSQTIQDCPVRNGFVWHGPDCGHFKPSFTGIYRHLHDNDFWLISRLRKSLQEIAKVERLLLSVQETADLLSIGKSKAYYLINNGTIPSIRIGKKSLRVPVGALKKFIDELIEAGKAAD